MLLHWFSKSICFGTMVLYTKKSWAYFEADYWVHPVDYFSEHTNGHRTEENEHDRTLHLQSEYAVGDSI
jgi:hypothetical protein